MATRPIDLRNLTAAPRGHSHLQAVSDLRSTDHAVVVSPVPSFDPTEFNEGKEERRERLATTGHGPRRLAASLLVVADAWMAPRRREDDRTDDVGRIPTGGAPSTANLGTAPQPSIDLTRIDHRTPDLSPADLSTGHGTSTSGRAKPISPLHARERPLQARRRLPAPQVERLTATAPAIVGIDADEPSPAIRVAASRPLRAPRDRPLRARPEPVRTQQDRPLRARPEPVRTQQDRPLRARPEPVVAVAPVPTGASPVLAMVDMREQHRPDRTLQAEQEVRSRRPGRPRKTMPDPRAVPPEVAAADEEAWQTWLSSSEPAGDRLEQLDADLAKPPRRLSRWVDAAATGRRSRTD
jgi:hypothetical protein